MLVASGGIAGGAIRSMAWDPIMARITPRMCLWCAGATMLEIPGGLLHHTPLTYPPTSSAF
jgi:hypothetical protein